MKLLLRAICVFWVTTTIGMPTLRAQLAAQDSLQRLLDAHPQQDDRRAELLNALAFLVHTSKPEQSLALAQEVIGFGKHITDKTLLAGAYTQKSIAFIMTSNLDSATYWSEKALELERLMKHTEGIASTLSNLGLIHYRLNHYPKALAYFQEAAHLFNETNHPNETNMYLNMSAIYSEMKNFDKAKEYLQQVRTESRRTGNKNVEAYALLNLGTLYTEEADYARGRRYLDSALVANQQVNDQSNIAKVYGNLAANYSRTGEHITSNSYYQKALPINTQLNNIRGIAVNAIGMGENYLVLDSLTKAFQWLSKARDLAMQQTAIDVQRDASKHLSTYFEKIGRYDSALYYHRQFTLLKDSIDNEAKRKELTRLELQYDFDLKEQDYIQQQTISRLKIKQLWLYGIIAIVFLVAVAGYLLNRSRVRTFRLRNEMREKELRQQAEALLLEQQVSESELKALRTQMNPHFMFNVLNSIESYILEKDAKSASKLVQQFAKLTRLVLENSTQSLVPADREWQATQLYVELEAIRFDHSFTYQFTVAGSLDLAEIALPPMLIQPLAENAILHGLRPVTGYPAQLNIRIDTEENHLVVYVEDNGVGLTAANAQKRTSTVYKEKSLGLNAIENRLALLKGQYPQSNPSLTVTDRDEPGSPGTRARLLLPLIPAIERSVPANT